MKIAVCGLWHLGSVTAACLAEKGFDVIAYDANETVIAQLNASQSPVFEPGLNDIIQKYLVNFTHELKQLNQAELIWITFDTPVNDDDQADIEFVINEIKTILPHVQTNTLILISSQLPVGSTRRLIDFCAETYPQKNIRFAYSPENLRLGKALEIFRKQERIVIGIENASDKEKLKEVLTCYSDNLLWMSIESAEMSKHAVNAFLATSVVFINELATLCEKVGADAHDVERSLKSEARIGEKAYLHAGNAIAGGTLLRDINYLIQIGKNQNVDTPFFSSILASNQAHKRWAARRLIEVLDTLKDKTITSLGLAYKAGTNALRRSHAIELCEFLLTQGAIVKAYDPVVQELPSNMQKLISLHANLEDALEASDAVVINSEWPEFNALSVELLLAKAKRLIVFDANGFLRKTLGNDSRVQYYSVGKTLCN